jgi:O-antigen/teichoic acid export membrane protein
MSLLRFGTPLLAVGVLKYMGTEADKAIVANIAGLDVFAIYILTLMLVVNGTNIINVALSKIFIRRLSVTQGSIAEAVKSNGVIYCYLILPLILVLCMFGENFIHLVFGRQYTTISFLILAICAVVSIRSLNHWLNQTVISRASTNLMLIADITRVLVAITGVAFFYTSADVITIVIIFGFAELTYFTCLTLLLQKRFPIITTSLHILSIFFIFMVILSGIYSLSFDKSFSLKLALTLPTLVIFYVIFLSFSKTCRRQTNALIRLIVNAKKFSPSTNVG